MQVITSIVIHFLFKLLKKLKLKKKTKCTDLPFGNVI